MTETPEERLKHLTVPAVPTAEQRVERLSVCSLDIEGIWIRVPRHLLLEEFRSAESAARQGCIARAIKELLDAEHFAIDWAHSAGWATGHGDTLADILREMRSDQEEQQAKLETAAREKCIRAIRRLQDGEVRGYDSILDDAINAIRALAGEEGQNERS